MKPSRGFIALLTCLAVYSAPNLAYGQSMGISSTAITPDASSILELRTTTKGLLIPRMTSTERNSISSAATGLIIYNTTTNKFNFYNGGWIEMSSGSAPVTSITGTSNRITVGGTATDPTIDISSSYVGQTSITTLGTIGTGTWNGSIVAGTYGGTGINNGANTITLGGPLVTSGAFTTTLTSTATTNATFPSGTNTLYSTKAGSITSAQLLSSLTNPTGTGVVVFGTSPTIATPVINGLPTGTGVSSSNAVSTLVARDGSGNFSAGTITAAITGNSTTATALATGRTIGMTGDVTWTSPSFDGSSNVTSTSTVTKINGTSLAALGTGILKNTTSTGVPSIAVAADFPTLNQSTTGSSATLTTTRAIYGGSFNGSADVTNIIASTYGGTGNGFTKFTGPITAEKTFTLPNASATILTDNAVVTAAQGGTGINTYTIGDLLYANSSTTLNKLTGVATGNALISGGTSTAPSWGKIGLTTHVSGILPIANGGTNSTATPTNGGIVYGDGTSYQVTAAGTSGQLLQSTGAGAPTWVSGGTMLLTGVSNNTTVNNTTLYFPMTGGIAGAAADAQAGLRTLVSRSGTVKNLYVKLSVALAGGKTGTVTVFKNGVATSLVVTLSVGPVDFNDTTNSFTVAPGDEIGIRIITTGNVKFSWAADFTF